MDKSLSQKNATHGRCDARPPAAGHHRPWTGTKSYCLVTETHVCEQLAQSCCLKAERSGRDRTRDVPSHKTNTLASTPPGYVSEMTMGQRITCHGSSGSTNLSGSRGSLVSTRDPLTHDQVNRIPRTGYFVAVMMFDFESTST